MFIFVSAALQLSLTDCYRQLQNTEHGCASPNGVKTEDAGASETADTSEFTWASFVDEMLHYSVL